MAQPPQPAPIPQGRSPAKGGLPSLHSFFAPGGMLAGAHPAYEFRRGQLQMAEAVEQALAERRHLVVEAGTGTGKTLAYLLPVIRSGKRVIISTGTKTLQEQLFHKDVPFLEQVLFPARGPAGGQLRVCYMKGRNNYVCRQKLYDLTGQPLLSGLEEITHFGLIAEWEKTTATGDRAELASLPELSALWPRLDARSEACTGSKCPQFERCFITEMHRRAAESDIIIVNHHLFFADLAIKQAAEDAPDAGILPDCGAVIFDEAHELEDVASSYFGITVSNARCDELARDLEYTLKLKRAFPTIVQDAVLGLRERSQLFFSLLPPGEGRFAFEGRREFLEENGDEYLALLHALGRLESELERMKEPEEVFNFARRAVELRAQLSFILESTDGNTVFWIERRGGEGRGPELAPRPAAAGQNRGLPGAPGLPPQQAQNRGLPGAPGVRRINPRNVYLQATPIDVSQILRQELFDKLQTAVLTSATLAVAGGFDYIRKRLGIGQSRELVVPPHFDYQNQALLYVPPEMPDPRAEAFPGCAAEKIRQVLEVTRGRAFCLFTSYAQMGDIYERLLGEVEYPMLLQGTAPKNALLDEFRLTPNAVLFATASFWQGVDVQGEQLSCVIIDRLPFAVPNDPVVAARIRAINEEGGNAFFEYQVPSAVITLKQGFGRLIRSLHDRGVLVLLDNRVLRQRYGRIFLESLPDYRRTTDFAEVERFFGAR